MTSELASHTQIAIDELNAFNYEEYKANGFRVKHLGDCHCELYDRPEGFSSVPLMCKADTRAGRCGLRWCMKAIWRRLSRRTISSIRLFPCRT